MAWKGRSSHDQLLTDPDQAVDFVMRTKVDALAIACGTSHGAYKFTRAAGRRHPRDGGHRGDPPQAAEYASGHAWLVIRSAALQDVINRFGGEMPQTYGVPVEEIERGIRHGVRKVNIDTDCRMAMSGQFRRIATENPARIRSAQIPQTRHGCHARSLPRPLRAVRNGRQCLEDQGDTAWMTWQNAMPPASWIRKSTAAKAA